MMKQELLALFASAGDASKGTAALKAQGFSADDWDVLADSPYPEGAFGEKRPKHKLFVFPFVGAACGLAVAMLMSAGTQLAFPLVVGGKPILSLPAMFIIAYEGTLLGAILFTFLGVIFESRLPRLRMGVYDPRITEGYIGVVVSCAEERLNAAADALKQAGATDILRDSKSRWVEHD